MARAIDLHAHTVYSDGSMAPAELVRRAVRAGIGTLAVTDHGTLAGLAEARRAAAQHHLRLLRGIELSALVGKTEVHLLGYDLRTEDPGLVRTLEELTRVHRVWFRATCAALERRGFSLNARVLRTTRAVLPGHDVLVASLCAARRNHARLQRDFSTTTPELFMVIDAYLSSRSHMPQRPVPLTAAAAIRILHEAGGVVVLAHPGRSLVDNASGMLARLRRLGLDGIEAITPNHTWHDVVRFQRLARQYRLFVTAGSDTHEHLPPSFTTPMRWSYFHTPLTRLPWRNS